MTEGRKAGRREGGKERKERKAGRRKGGGTSRFEGAEERRQHSNFLLSRVGSVRNMYEHSKNELGKKYEFSKNELGKKHECSKIELGKKYENSRNIRTVPFFLPSSSHLEPSGRASGIWRCSAVWRSPLVVAHRLEGRGGGSRVGGMSCGVSIA
jgi:hypothetical protein